MTVVNLERKDSLVNQKKRKYCTAMDRLVHIAKNNLQENLF